MNLPSSPHKQILIHSLSEEYDDEDVQFDSFALNKKLRVNRAQFDNPSVKLPLNSSSSVIRPPTFTDNSLPHELPPNNSLQMFRVFTSPIMVELQLSQRNQHHQLKSVTQTPEETPQSKRQSKRESIKKFMSQNQSMMPPDRSNILLRFMMRGIFILKFITNLKSNAHFYKGLTPNQKQLLEEQYLPRQDNAKRKREVRDTQKSGVIQSFLQNQVDAVCKKSCSIITVPIFEPLSVPMLIWRALHTLVQFLIFFFVPFLISFQVGTMQYIDKLEWIFYSVSILDGLIRQNQAYISRGQTVRDREQIWRHYILTHALKDALEMCSLVMIFQFEDAPWIMIFVVMYLYLSTEKVTKTVTLVQEHFHFNGILNEGISLIKLIIVILVISHSCACLWHFVGAKSLEFGNYSWILQKDLGEATILSLYNYSFYWATMTMVTVGYGDVSAQNDLEVCVATCTMFVTCGVFAYAINSIGIILSNIQEEKGKAKKTLSLINQYMSSHQVDHELQGRIRNYLDYCLLEEREVDDEDIQHIVEKLSTNLRQELFQSIRGKALVHCRVLQKTFSEDAQSGLLNCMETLKYIPEEVIIQENMLDDCAIYMIQKGNVVVLCKDKVVQTLHPGDSFGERAFFTSQLRSCSVKAVDFVKLYKISQESALRVLTSPIDKEKWCYIRDSISLYEQYGAAKMQCYSCGRSNHIINACPELFFKPDLERIIKKQEFSDGQERSIHLRHNLKQSSWGLFKQLQDQTKHYRSQKINNPSSDNDDEDDDEGDYTDRTSDEHKQIDSEIVSSQKQGSTSINNIEQPYDGKYSSGSYQYVGGSSSDGISLSQNNQQKKEPSFLTNSNNKEPSFLTNSNLKEPSFLNSSNQNILQDMIEEEDDQFVQQQQFPRNDLPKGTLQTASFNNETIHSDHLSSKKFNPSLHFKNLQVIEEQPQKSKLRVKVPPKKEEGRVYQSTSPSHHASQYQHQRPNSQHSIENHYDTVRTYSHQYAEETESPHRFRLVSQPTLPSNRRKSDEPHKSHQKKQKRTLNFPGSAIKLPQIVEEEQDNFLIDRTFSDLQGSDLQPMSFIGRDRRKQSTKTNQQGSKSMQRMSSKLSTINHQRRESTFTGGTQKTGTYFKQSNLNINQNQTMTTTRQADYNQLVDISVYQENHIQEQDLDLMKEYQHYFSLNNVEDVIKRCNRFMKLRTKVLESKYTLYYIVKKRAQRIKKVLNKRLSKMENKAE